MKLVLGFSAVAGTVFTVLGYLIAGPAGLVATMSLAAGCLVLASYQLTNRPAGTDPFAPAPSTTRSAAARPTFSRLHRIESELAWAALPGHRYEPAVRRMIADLYIAAVARSHRSSDLPEEAARDLVGADLWPYVCPEDSRYAAHTAPGPAVLTRLVDRLEQL